MSSLIGVFIILALMFGFLICVGILAFGIYLLWILLEEER